MTPFSLLMLIHDGKESILCATKPLPRAQTLVSAFGTEIMGKKSKNLADLRFVVESADGRRSLDWRLWVEKKGDVYLSSRSMAGIQKYSFHASGKCRSAFTEQYGSPWPGADRAIHKWERMPTPAVPERASHVALLAFPSDYLSGPFPARINMAPVTTLAAAPAGSATVIELSYTCASEEYIMRAFAERNQQTLILYTRLSEKEGFIVSTAHVEWENEDLRIQSEIGRADLMFSAQATPRNIRPLRFFFGPKPLNGDALMLQELGGCPAPQIAVGASETTPSIW